MDTEDSIRKIYRERRDKLNSLYSKLDLLSKGNTRTDLKILLGNDANIYDWLMLAFDKLEQLEIEVNALKTDEEILNVLEKIDAWQKTYQPYLDSLKRESDKLQKTLKPKGFKKK